MDLMSGKVNSKTVNLMDLIVRCAHTGMVTAKIASLVTGKMDSNMDTWKPNMQMERLLLAYLNKVSTGKLEKNLKQLIQTTLITQHYAQKLTSLNTQFITLSEEIYLENFIKTNSKNLIQIIMCLYIPKL